MDKERTFTYLILTMYLGSEPPNDVEGCFDELDRQLHQYCHTEAAHTDVCMAATTYHCYQTKRLALAVAAHSPPLSYYPPFTLLCGLSNLLLKSLFLFFSWFSLPCLLVLLAVAESGGDAFSPLSRRRKQTRCFIAYLSSQHNHNPKGRWRTGCNKVRFRSWSDGDGKRAAAGGGTRWHHGNNKIK